MNYNCGFKLFMVGSDYIGKTSIKNRISEQKFSDQYISTIGLDYSIQSIDINGFIVQARIWDTAGLKRFRSIIQSFYRDAEAFYLVYDISNRGSFETLKKDIFQEVKEYGRTDILFLIGSKSDLENQRQVQYDEAQEFANSNGISHFYEVSAKTGQNIDKIFYSLIQCYLKRQKLNQNVTQ